MKRNAFIKTGLLLGAGLGIIKDLTRFINCVELASSVHVFNFEAILGTRHEGI